MAAINDVSIPGLNGIMANTIKAALVAQLWEWINEHANDPIYSFKWAFFSKTFRVKDLHAVFERILGADPVIRSE